MNDLDPRLRQLAERALAGIPVPESRVRATGGRFSSALVVGVTALIVVAAALGTGRFLNELRQNDAAATPPARPTSTAGHDIAPLPNEHRNARYGYNLLLPAWFHHSEAETVWARQPELDSREVFTARTPQEERQFLSDSTLPWDLIVEVYERKGASTETWAEWLGCSWIGQPPPGKPHCALDHAMVGGASALVGSTGDPLPGKMYLIDRGQQLLALRYSIGTGANRPADVTEAILEQAIHSIGLVESEAASTAAPRVLSDAELWPYLRATLPADAPIPVPLWLPDTVDREHVTLSGVAIDAADPHFVVTYHAPKGTIVYALGPADEIPGSGAGARVRGQPASLTFATSLFNEPHTLAPRRLRWRENGHTLSISSETFTGDDLLHIAWSFDPSSAPLRPFARTAAGACAKAGGSPEETVRSYVELLGRRDANALADCFADEVLGGADGSAAADFGSTLPTARVDDVRRLESIGGRISIGATWTFASDPGGPWSPRPTMFFLVGLDSGHWRIYEQGTAPFGPMP